MASPGFILIYLVFICVPPDSDLVNFQLTSLGFLFPWVYLDLSCIYLGLPPDSDLEKLKLTSLGAILTSLGFILIYLVFILVSIPTVTWKSLN